MNPHNLQSIGWKPFFEQQLPMELQERSFVARVSAHFGSQVLLLGETGEFRVAVQLAESAGEVAVGDWLVLDVEDQRAIQRLQRQTLLYRKAAGKQVKSQLIAANIDTIFIVSSCNEDFNLSRIERYLALVLQAGAVPVVVLTKADLCDNTADLRRLAEQLHAGLIVETLDARQPEQAEILKSWCRPGQSVALLGSSGVGKSTLAGALGVSGLATGEIREQDGKGRHVTTARSLHLLPSGGVLVDNPGMRELQLPACEAGVADVFVDILQFAEKCKFNDCNHDGDAGCAVGAAVESGELDQRRVDNFKKLSAEQAHNSRSLAERRQRDRERGRIYKSIQAEKRRRHV
ncbi:MAG: ribosome small subunit-dependent GTPase A [Bythopirellula sp.]